MTSLRKLTIAIVAVAALVLATGCSGASDSEGDETSSAGAGFDLAEADREATVVVGDQLQDLSLDPADVLGLYNLTELAPIYDTLLRVSVEGEVEPGLAEAWEIVDPSTISLTLRPDVTFSDGTPVDGEAVRTNLLRMKDVDTGELDAILQELSDIEVPSPTEAVLKLSSPVAGEFTRVLYGNESLMVSPAALADPTIDLRTQAVGAGPYEVASFKPDQALVLERKESYWDVDSYPIKTIDIRNVADGSPRVAALIAGDIQFTRSDDATIITSLANTPSAEVLTSDGQYLTYVNYCKNRAPFNDPNVRRAFSAAIDRSALVEGVTAGRGKPAFQAWAEGSPNFNPDAVSAYDVDEARSLLKGKEVEVDMSFLPVIPGHERLGEILQAQLAEVGINVNLKPNENPDDAFRESNDAVLMASSLQGVQRVRQLGRDSVSNLCGYSSPELDTLTRKIATLDPESDEANQAWHDVATLIHDDELLSVLFFRPTVTAFSKDKVNSMSFSTPQTDFRFVYAK